MRPGASPGSRGESIATIALVAGFLVVVYGGLLVVLWQLGIFDLSGDTNAQVLAPVLALLGAAFGASLTLVGVMLKHSIDVRTFRLAQETEQRLRLETSIRGVDLLALDDGKPAPPTQQAGALFALVQLGEIDLAIALLGEIWPRREISTPAAVWVADSGLRSDVPHLQLEAASVVSANAETLANQAGLQFPNCVSLKWSTEMYLYARDALLDALVRSLLARAPRDSSSETLNVYLLQFDVIRKAEATSDSGQHIRAGAILGLGLVAHSKQFSDGNFVLRTADGPVAVEEVRREVAPLIGQAYQDAANSISKAIEAAWGDWVPENWVPPSQRV